MRAIPFLILLTFLLVSGDLARAETRVALVIGNNDYTHETLPDLNNARMDAQGIADKLRALGFEVILRVDASRRQMGRALAEFERKLTKADVGLVIYAGHGIEFRGVNYLIPADARLEIEDDLRYEALDVNEFLRAMEFAGAPLNKCPILLLDVL